MAKVKIESIVDHLSSEMKRALEAALSNVVPAVHIDRDELFREFRREVGRKCSTWETVNDSHVKKRCHECGKDT